MSLFVDLDPQTMLPQMVADFEAYTGATLREGDQRRMMLQGFAYVLTGVLQSIENAGLQNLLNSSTGRNLEELGALIGVERLPAQAAETTLRFTLSGALAQAVTIPQGTRATPDGTLFFATQAPLTIPAGETSGTVEAAATAAGSGYNGFIPGQITTLVDGTPFVASVTNTVESAGGAGAEEDEDYRARIRQAPYSFSAAGPSGAYEYFALSASNDVGDVYVKRLSPGVVGIYVVKKGGIIPDEADPVISAVEEACSARDRRPLTDDVRVAPAVAAEQTVSAKYWIAEEDQTRAGSIQTAVSAAVEAYKAWQTERIGRSVNPDELRRRMLNAGAARIELTAPAYSVLSAEQVAQFTATDVTYQGVE